MKKILLTIVASLVFLIACAEDPRLDRFLPKDGVVKKDRVHLAFDPARKTPVWTAYYYDPTNADHKLSREGKSFRKDAMIPESSSPAAYDASGYDRGHMVPANDMEFSDIALTETFLTSNIVPQNPKINRGVWKDIETLVRKLGRETELVVITGPLYEKDAKRRTLMDGTVIPDAVFKIVHSPKGGWTIAFVVPNDGTGAIVPTGPSHYEVPWLEVEDRIGVNFNFGVK